MPTYEYVCKKCGYEFEQYQSMKDDSLKHCPKCETDSLKRKIGTGAGIIFKGSGFYCNDYKGANASLPPAAHAHHHEDGCGCGCGCKKDAGKKSEKAS